MSFRFAPSVVSILLAFFACLASAETSPAPEARTGLEGVMTMSPIRGGPVKEGEPSSGPLPGRAFVISQGDRLVAEFETDAQGQFRVLLPAGHYTIVGKEPKNRFDHHGPRAVEVVDGKMTRIEWDFDSGMR